MTAPDFFVVGAPKSGTTAMHEYLRRHPRIFMPEVKELHYFGSDLSGLPAALLPDQHESLFRKSEGFDRVGETCIWALYSREAAREIKAARPDARIVAMLRDPVKMIDALHSEYLYQAIEDIKSLPRALNAEGDRKEGRRLPCGDFYPAAIYYYREIATFSIQLERYFDLFGRDRVHVIFYDELRTDTAGVYRGLLEFLEVDPAFRPDFPRINPNKAIRSRHLQHLIYNPNYPGRPLFDRLVPSAATRQRWLQTAARWNVTNAPRRPIPSRLLGRLRAEFAPEVDRLGALVGRDLAGVWGT